MTCFPLQIKAFASLREEGLGRFTVAGSCEEWEELSPDLAHRLSPKEPGEFLEEKTCVRLGTLL